MDLSEVMENRLKSSDVASSSDDRGINCNDSTINATVLQVFPKLSPLSIGALVL